MFSCVAATAGFRIEGPPGAVRRRIRTWACLLLAAAIGAQRLTAGAAAFGQAPQMYPQPGFTDVHTVFHAGDYRAALQGYKIQSQNGMASVIGRFIDSICYQAMQGECHYQLGQFDQALTHYDAAVRHYLADPKWLARVTFSPGALQAANARQLTPTPWHTPTRGALTGAYQVYVQIPLGVNNNNNNNNNQPQGAAVVAAPVLVSINAQEIVRCTCLAIRRRGELLGAASPHNALTRDLVQELSPRPALPNHWSQAWVLAELGMAYAAAGREKQAVEALKKAELAAGQFDHPLTGMVLLELGRLAMKGGDFDAADSYCREATCSAAQFADLGVMEEAFRLGSIAHLMSGKPSVYPPLDPALVWAKANRAAHLQASLAILAAENLSALDQPEEAAMRLAQASHSMLGSDMLAGRVGARFNHARALASFQLGRVNEGEQALDHAMGFQQQGSLWLYHMEVVDHLWREHEVSDRTSLDLFQDVLREPTPADWASDPLESLSSLVGAHVPIFEHWFEATLKITKEHQRALEISDRVRKHRFLVSQEWGGRLVNLRWVLEGPPEFAGRQGMLDRQALLARYPAYDEASKRAIQLRSELGQMPLVPDDPAVAEEQKAKLAELTEVSAAQEGMLRAIALRREPCALVFPPLRTTDQVQTQLRDGEALLAFFTSKRVLYAFLITKEKYAYWKVDLPRQFSQQVVSLLHGWGNFDQNKELRFDDLANDAWKKQGKSILDALMKESKTELAGVGDELVIVPDGALWYVPFEALQFSSGDGTRPLLSKLRIRYAPTIGLAVGERRPRRQDGNTAVVVGKLYPRDAAEVSQAEFDKLSHVASGAAALAGSLPAPSGVYAALFDRLVVLNDVLPPKGGGPYDWSPVQVDRTTHGNALSNWFLLPWGGPDQIVLPGFHTPAERALKNVASPTGDDLFLSICGLMSTGARTVLISRWRTGGQTSYNLVREFVQELPHAAAAEAWQRSVLLAESAEIEPGLEPRIKLKANEKAPKAENPFFWAGYLLADTGSSPHDPLPEVEDVIQIPQKMPKRGGPVAAADADDNEAMDDGLAQADDDGPLGRPRRGRADADDDPPPGDPPARGGKMKKSRPKPVKKAPRTRVQRQPKKSASPPADTDVDG